MNLTLVTPEKAIKLAANDVFRQKLSKDGYIDFLSFIRTDIVMFIVIFEKVAKVITAD